MNELLINVIKGAAIGFLGAVMFDLQKWNESTGSTFDWKTAGLRWLKGAATGAAGALGLSV